MHDGDPLPRLASRVRVDALLRRVSAAGGFATVLARGDDEAGAIAVVTREAGEEALRAAVPGGSGRYEFAELARGDAVPAWIERARRRDPDLWVIELDIPQAGQFVAEMLDGG
ncbi:DUF1491 family protein [Sandarakinorhabdus sp. AAP62]|uniref:DUF1491 family protein n=1 Tax=Sandarakinorhabdus sp. AAP62 TaxID=1248916 RepID=UPI00031F17EA|nr:DUF1491 family protein [Sandarakinorhabdus sp. AAP62]